MNAPETTTAAAVERWCEIMHDAYEAAAVGAGWETQQASRKPWADVPEANKATMRAAVRAVTPAIAARALREFATHIQFAEWPMPPDIGHVAMEAHARADEIEAGR